MPGRPQHADLGHLARQGEQQHDEHDQPGDRGRDGETLRSERGLAASARAVMMPGPSCEARKFTTIDFERASRPVLMNTAELAKTRRSKAGRSAMYGR